MALQVGLAFTLLQVLFPQVGTRRWFDEHQGMQGRSAGLGQGGSAARRGRLMLLGIGNQQQTLVLAHG